MSELSHTLKLCSLQSIDSFHINNLSDEELIHIFECLPIISRLRLRPVCDRWKSSVERSLRASKMLDVYSLGVELSYHCLGLVFQLCPNVKVIDLSHVRVFWPDKHVEEHGEDVNEDEHATLEQIMRVMTTNCLRVQSLNLTKTNLDHYVDQFCIENPDYFRRLRTLVSREISDHSLNCLLDSEHIETIDVEQCCRVRRPLLHRLGPNVKNLSLRLTRVWETDVVQSLCDGNGNGLRKLSIDVHNDRIWELICNRMTELRELRAALVTTRCDTSLVSNLFHLKSLWIEESLPLDNDVLIQLIQSLKSLSITELSLLLFTSRDINPILVEVQHNCPLIQKLVIKGKHFVTDIGWTAITGLQHMTYLDLSGCRLKTSTSLPISSSLKHLILNECKFFSLTKGESFVEMCGRLTADRFVVDVNNTCLSDIIVKSSGDLLSNNLIIIYDVNE